MKSNKNLTLGALLIIGFTCIIFSGLNWHMALAAWLSPIFLLRYSRNTKKLGFLLFFIVSIFANAISHNCLAIVDLFILHAINGLSYGIFFCIPYLIDRLIYKPKKGFYTTLIFPSALVLFEYTFTMIYGSWGSIAHTQYSINQLTQIVSISGLFGLTFLVTWFGSTLNWIIENEYSLKSIKKGILIYGGIFFIIFLYGDLRLTYNTRPSQTVKVAAISCDIDIQQIFIDEYETITSYTEGKISVIPERIFADKIYIEKQIEKTIIAAKNDAKIIVWNEITLILNKEQVDSLKIEIQKVSKEYNSYILLAYLEENISDLPKPFNNKSVMIQPDGNIAWEYKKAALHPQAEVPIINKGEFKIPFIDTPYGRIGNVICYDIDLTKYIQQTSKNKIDIMLVPSYDWEKITPLHSNMASFEAIQNGFSLVRPNGEGPSVAVNYYGNIIAQLNTFTTDNKIIYADLPTQAKNTIYAKIGNLFVYLCMLILIISIILRIYNRSK